MPFLSLIKNFLLSLLSVEIWMFDYIHISFSEVSWASWNSYLTIFLLKLNSAVVWWNTGVNIHSYWESDSQKKKPFQVQVVFKAEIDTFVLHTYVENGQKILTRKGTNNFYLSVIRWDFYRKNELKRLWHQSCCSPPLFFQRSVLLSVE